MKILRDKTLKFIVINMFLIILLTVPVTGAETLSVMGEVSDPIEGLGTEEKPYRYLIDEGSKVTWKHLTDNYEKGVTEVYECREGDTADGKLLYSYTFHAEDLLPNASGPYFLEIRIYDQEAVEGLPGYPDAMFFSFATKRDFPGKVEIKLYVSDSFSDGTKLDLTYYGGYDSTVIHGPAPVPAKDEIRQVDSKVVQTEEELVVENGMVTFDIRYGGNYILHEEPVDFSGFGVSEVTHYDADKVLGSIGSIFPTEKIAETVASALGKEKTETITQGDIDSIKTLYLASIGLENIEELERVYFSRLESLTLSGNELESLNNLSMPALTYLDVSGNQLKSVNALAKLGELENVDLSHNDLISLPDLSQLAHLQTLDLSNNHLQMIPALQSNELRYLDVSSNAVIWIADGLKNCTSLDTAVMTGQVLNTESKISVAEDFYLEPVPRFISQFGNGGTVMVSDSRGKKIYEENFSALESNGFFLRGDLFDKNDVYMVTVKGTVIQDGLEENLGIYTYKVTAGSGIAEGLDVRKMTAVGVVIILLGCGIGLALHARKQRKRNKENRL